jgi:polysaccharide biosynthesis/export protein
MGGALLRRCGPLFALALACSHVGEFVWVDAYQERERHDPAVYVIQPGDLLAVRVYNQEGMSGRARVRADGRISLPFLNDVDVAGVEPPTIGKRLQVKLKEFMVNPVVTVSLEEPAPLEVAVVGEVVRPGAYVVDRDAGVLNALAKASGFTEYARRDRIFVLRADAARAPARIRFTYEALAHAEGAAARFRLRRGDVIVVE